MLIKDMGCAKISSSLAQLFSNKIDPYYRRALLLGDPVNQIKLMAENHALSLRNLLLSFILRERYPSLLLFPAGRKKAIPYGGDIVVSNIINFLAHHGGHFYDLLQEKGILWSEGEPGINHNMNAESPPFKNLPHEIILQEGPPTLDVQFSQNRAPLSSSAKTSPHVIVGSTLLIRRSF